MLHNSAHPRAGRQQVRWLREAGFSRVEASASYDCWTKTPQETRRNAAFLANLVSTASFAQQLISAGLADRPTLEQMRRVMNNFAMPAIHDLLSDSRSRVAKVKESSIIDEDIYYRDIYLPILEMLGVDRREMRNRVSSKKSAENGLNSTCRSGERGNRSGHPRYGIGLACSEPHRTGDDMIERFVLFGASGDLASRLLLPSLAGLVGEGSVPKNMQIVGSGTDELSTDDFRKKITDALAVHAAQVDEGPRQIGQRRLLARRLWSFRPRTPTA